jgi:hypothetical protein
LRRVRTPQHYARITAGTAARPTNLFMLDGWPAAPERLPGQPGLTGRQATPAPAEPAPRVGNRAQKWYFKHIAVLNWFKLLRKRQHGQILFPL